jgi:hypothetical protein
MDDTLSFFIRVSFVVSDGGGRRWQLEDLLMKGEWVLSVWVPSDPSLSQSSTHSILQLQIFGQGHRDVQFITFHALCPTRLGIK